MCKCPVNVYLFIRHSFFRNAMKLTDLFINFSSRTILQENSLIMKQMFHMRLNATLHKQFQVFVSQSKTKSYKIYSNAVKFNKFIMQLLNKKEEAATKNNSFQLTVIRGAICGNRKRAEKLFILSAILPTTRAQHVVIIIWLSLSLGYDKKRKWYMR